MNKHPMSEDMPNQNTNRTDRRKLLAIIGVGGVAAVAIPSRWSKPIIDSVILPAHAQTSMCTADATTGGPLIGNGFGAATCEAACEAEAISLNAQLCSFDETTDVLGAVQCGCDIDLP